MNDVQSEKPYFSPKPSVLRAQQHSGWHEVQPRAVQSSLWTPASPSPMPIGAESHPGAVQIPAAPLRVGKALSGLSTRQGLPTKHGPRNQSSCHLVPLTLAQKYRPGFTGTGAIKFMQQHDFSSLYHSEKVKSRLRSLHSQEITLSLAHYPQAKPQA